MQYYSAVDFPSKCLCLELFSQQQMQNPVHPLSLFPFYDFRIYVFMCLYENMCMCVYVPKESRRGCQIPWSWIYRCLWAAGVCVLTQVLTIEPQVLLVTVPLSSPSVCFMCRCFAWFKRCVIRATIIWSDIHRAYSTLSRYRGPEERLNIMADPHFIIAGKQRESEEGSTPFTVPHLLSV